jgi:hypothetical protein
VVFLKNTIVLMAKIFTAVMVQCVFAKACHWTLPWASWIMSITAHSNFLMCILKLSYYISVCLPSNVFCRSFSTKVRISHMRAKCPSCLIPFNSTI